MLNNYISFPQIQVFYLPSTFPHTEYVDHNKIKDINKTRAIVAVFAILDVLAVSCTIFLSFKIKTHFKERQKQVLVSIQGIIPETFTVPLPDYSIEAVNEFLSSSTQKWDDYFQF
ncbi:Hypothetical_protein [Hexamita inflata]|uniref:Hypothetical_protein n=1 Tax=Hexamita inflata TaxID=28002 RepID=A0AA86TL56_9EUKA|nr:Hypothetical protein HINF_LOCUS9554 [Hexamita inflata]